MREAKELSYWDWRALFRSWGEPAYRADQVCRWLYQKQVNSFAEMTDLSARLRERLSNEIQFFWPWFEKIQESTSEPGVRKYLLGLSDGAAVEAVRLPYRNWVSVCLSSQVGCRLRCQFCETGKNGLERNLTAGEMLAQLLVIRRDCLERGEAEPGRIVVMGMGEPLDNLSGLTRFIGLVTHPKGLRFGARRLTVSTAGLVPGIYELAHLGVPLNLALSLHSVDDETRGQIMPINRLYPVDQVLRAGDYFSARTGRRVMIEYTLLAGFNDNPGEADRLARKLQGRTVVVNVIPANPVSLPGMEPAPEMSVTAFSRRLEQAGVNVTRRREMGQDVNGACGQLRGSFSQRKREVL